MNVYNRWMCRDAGFHDTKTKEATDGRTEPVGMAYGVASDMYRKLALHARPQLFDIAQGQCS